MDRNDNPQPGQYWSGGRKFRESYGGIIAAINDITVRNNQTIKRSYPENFGGIIEALMDMGDWLAGDKVPGSNVDEKPPGSNIIIDINGNISIDYPNGEPLSGTLWFDTRQGRLFVWDGDDWFQTNGADGLCHLETDPPDSPVVGDMWADRDDGALFVYDGLNWIAVGGSTDLQTTASLPLAALMVEPSSTDHSNLLDPNDYEFEFQNSFNIFLWQCLQELDKYSATVLTTDDGVPPAIDGVPVSSLWFDRNDLTLSILHDDGDSVQWVPVHAGYDPSTVVREIDNKLTNEIDRRLLVEQLQSERHQQLEAALAELAPLSDAVDQLQNSGIGSGQLSALESELRALITANSHSIAASAEAQNQLCTCQSSTEVQVKQLQLDLGHLEALVKALDPAKDQQLQQQITALQQVDAQLQAGLDDRITNADFDLVIDDLTRAQEQSLSSSGGVLSGGLKIEHNDVAEVGLDFSSAYVNSEKALKFTTDGGHGVLIGATEPHQLAVQLDGAAEFAVRSTAGKQLSVSDHGVIAKHLMLADFNANGSNGVEVLNKIDVKERLEDYQQAFEGMRHALATAASFDEFKAELTPLLSGL